MYNFDFRTNRVNPYIVLHIIDIYLKGEEYLNEIYDENGKIIIFF